MNESSTTRCGSTCPACAAAVLVLSLFTGCMLVKPVGPDYTAPETAMPDRWHAAAIEGLDDGTAHLATWWTTFDDPVLNDLIVRAREGNHDLKIAVGRIQEARAYYGAAEGQWFPGTDVFGNYRRTQVSRALSTVPAGRDARANNFDLGFDSSWEIDFWGRIVRLVEAASASVEAEFENRRDALVILYRDVALSYFELRAVQARIELLDANLNRQRETLKLVIDRNTAGLAAELDVRQGELNVARTESALPTLRAAELRAVHRLAVLTGSRPEEVKPMLLENGRLPTAGRVIGFSAPAELLRQRPDIRRAERELAAQHARIGLAKADLYPRLSLVGTFAVEASEFSNLFASDAMSHAFGPSIRWRVFNRGRVKGEILAAEARTERALHEYERTVLRAVAEVEDAIADYAQELRRREALTRAAAAAARSVELSKALYGNTQTDFQNVFAMESLLREQQDLLAESESLAARHLVRIYAALGGGWDPETGSVSYGNRNAIRGVNGVSGSTGGVEAGASTGR